MSARHISVAKRLQLFGFRQVYNSSEWVRKRFTPAGLLVLSVLVISAAMGVDTNLNLAHQLFGLMLALLLIALLWAPFFRSRFDARRTLPRYGTVGQALNYRLDITNTGKHSEQGLALFDLLNATPPSAAAFGHLQEPGNTRRNWFDRVVGYPRWASYMRRRAGANDPYVTLPALQAGESRTINIQMQPARRGYLQLSQTLVTRTDPLGLFRAVSRVHHHDHVLVLPQRYAVPPLTLPGSRRYQQGGVAMASEIGESDEFISLRDYRPGDPLRNIHWKSLARAGKPAVKEYQDEFFVRHALILDTFTGHTDDPDFEAAVSVAASFAATIDTQESLLDMLFVESSAHCITVGRGIARNDYLLEVLASVGPSAQADFASLTDAVMAQGHRLSGCICVLLDWDAPRQALIHGLRASGVPCLVLITAAALAAKPPAAGPMSDEPQRFHVLHPDELEQGLARL